MAHRDEVPYVEGAESLPAVSFLQRVLLWLERWIMSGPPPCRVTRMLEDGETIEELGGLCFGHGEPILEGAGERIQELLEDDSGSS